MPSIEVGKAFLKEWYEGDVSTNSAQVLKSGIPYLTFFETHRHIEHIVFKEKYVKNYVFYVSRMFAQSSLT